jgi:hypothetical protein
MHPPIAELAVYGVASKVNKPPWLLDRDCMHSLISLATLMGHSARFGALILWAGLKACLLRGSWETSKSADGVNLVASLRKIEDCQQHHTDSCIHAMRNTVARILSIKTK